MGLGINNFDRTGLPIASQRTTVSWMYSHKVCCLTAVHTCILNTVLDQFYKCMSAVERWFVCCILHTKCTSLLGARFLPVEI